MGSGSSRAFYEPRSRRRSPASNLRRSSPQKRRRGLLRKFRPAPTIQTVIPIRYRSPRRYTYGSRPYVLPRPAYAPVYPGYMPIPYNNYAVPSYMSPRQPMMIPQQQYQPMVMPQSQPMMMQQPILIPQPQPMPIPQQVLSPMFSPYMSSPYSMGAPLSTPYVQQQPQMQPVYNNIGVSAPVSTGRIGPTGPYSSPYPGPSVIKLSTDWTGGGKISPGFLGPPI